MTVRLVGALSGRPFLEELSAVPEIAQGIESVPIRKTVLDARGLRKSYGQRLVLDGVSLSVRAGEVIGLLGPNGAGKTTTLSILATLLSPDAGDISISGMTPGSDRHALRRKLGLIPQSIALYPTLSALQNVHLFARVHGLSKGVARDESMRVLEEVGLTQRAHDAVALLSGGMQRRLNLACGMVHRPEVLLMDEPTVGIDPQSRESIMLTVRRAAEAGAGVIYSTHYMDEVERLCDGVFLIDRGRVVANGTVGEIIALGGRQPRMELTFQQTPPPGWCDGLPGVIELAPADGDGKAALELESLAQISELLEQARACGGHVLEFSVHSPNLSDAFIALTGHALREPGAEPR